MDAKRLLPMVAICIGWWRKDHFRCSFEVSLHVEARRVTNIIKCKLKRLCGLLLTLSSLLIINLSDEPNVTLPKKLRCFELYTQGDEKLTCIAAKQQWDGKILYKKGRQQRIPKGNLKTGQQATTKYLFGSVIIVHSHLCLHILLPKPRLND